MNEIPVVCVVLKRADRVLIARRNTKIASGIYEFPGGKIEKEETQEQACIRELKEELAVEIKIHRFLCDCIDDAFVPPVHVFAYLGEIIKGEPKMSVHDKLEWVPIKDLDASLFQAADLPIITYVKKHL